MSINLDVCLDLDLAEDLGTKRKVYDLGRVRWNFTLLDVCLKDRNSF